MMRLKKQAAMKENEQKNDFNQLLKLLLHIPPSRGTTGTTKVRYR